MLITVSYNFRTLATSQDQVIRSAVGLSGDGNFSSFSSMTNAEYINEIMSGDEDRQRQARATRITLNEKQIREKYERSGSLEEKTVLSDSLKKISVRRAWLKESRLEPV